MPHADFTLVPIEITEKKEFWTHVQQQLKALLEGQQNWITNLANAASLLYHSLLSFPSHFGSDIRAVNWCGFYIDSSMFPNAPATKLPTLLLGPFSGKPACQLIYGQAGRGVCADAYVSGETIIAIDVDAYPGHIACDGETKSEIVVPLIHPDSGRKLGVLDLDCLAKGGFTQEDREGLEGVARIIVAACDW